MKAESNFPRNDLHANADLMRAMGSKKGSDPIPPDQYLFYLEDDDPEQKVLAYVRSKTIRMGYRSPFCVDQHGRPITLTKMAADLGWIASHTSEYLSKLEAKGLVRIEHGKEPGTSREIRIYLCGEVPFMSQRQAKKRRSPVLCTWKCPDYLLKQINNLPERLQKLAFERAERVDGLQRELEAEAIAAARATAEGIWDQFYQEFGLVKRKLKPDSKASDALPEKTPRVAVQVTILEAQVFDSVHGNGNSVQTAAATAYGVSNGAVQHSSADPSLYAETETEEDSGAAAVATSVRTPEPAPAAAIQPIVEAFAPHGGITDSRARRLLRDCSTGTVEEIAAKATQIAAGVTGRKNVVGILLTQLPEFFHGAAGLAQWRREREDLPPNVAPPTDEDLAAMYESERRLREELAEPLPPKKPT